MAPRKTVPDRPKPPSGAVARLLLDAGDRSVTNNRDLLDRALDFANQDAEQGESGVIARRAELRQCLNQYLADPAGLFRRLQHGDLNEELDRIRPVFSWWLGEIDGRYAARRFDEIVPTSWRALLAYLVALLFDIDEDLGKDLCRCQLDTCAKFFLAKKPEIGRVRRRYHDKECMATVHAARAGIRKLKSYSRRAGVNSERWLEMNAEERATALRLNKQRRPRK